ncbi:hypothetical protein Tco_0904274, partial [Tanacetum coccineum]
LIEVPVVILTYSFFQKDMKQSSYLKAVARGLLALLVGAIVNALGAIALGAPLGTRCLFALLVVYIVAKRWVGAVDDQYVQMWWGRWREEIIKEKRIQVVLHITDAIQD